MPRSGPPAARDTSRLLPYEQSAASVTTWAGLARDLAEPSPAAAAVAQQAAWVPGDVPAETAV